MSIAELLRCNALWNRSRGLAALAVALLVGGADAASAVKRRAFVTSISGTANISSWPGATGATTLERADSICRTLAANADTPLPNANSYRAWISTTSTDAWCHVQGLGGKKATGCVGGPPTGGGPWYLSNGATSWSGTLDELTGPEAILYRPLSRDESFDDLPTDPDGRRVWTGTKTDGTAAAERCGDWALASGGSGRAGDSRATAGRWTESNAPDCAGPGRLICVEPGPSEATRLAWSPAAIVFATSERGPGALSSWPEAEGATGLAAGDAICSNLAEAASLPQPDRFVAWLSTTGVDAIDRITTDGPFKRIDAFTVAGNRADLSDGSVDTSLHMTEKGDYFDDTVSVFTGTGGDGVWTGLSCNDWFGTSPAEATAGLASYAGIVDWTDNWEAGCGTQGSLYCISNQVVLFWESFEVTGDLSRWTSVGP
jgi:hypothetical protein